MKTETDVMIFDRYLYSGEEIQLTAIQTNKLKMLEEIHDLIQLHIYKWDVIDKISTNYRVQRKVAYDLFDDAFKLFQCTQADLIANRLHRTHKKLWSSGKYAECAKIDATLLKHEEKKSELAILETKTEKTQPHTFILGFFPELTKAEVPDNYMEIIKKQIEKKHNKTIDIEDARVIEPRDKTTS